jgi:hypothetical protein
MGTVRSSSGGRHLIANLNAATNKRHFFAMRSGDGSNRCGASWLAQAQFETYTAFAISRSLNFWILPVLVFGMSAKTM